MEVKTVLEMDMICIGKTHVREIFNMRTRMCNK